MVDGPAPATAGTRLAEVADADEVARLLHQFNTEFDTESPGPAVLAPRLAALLEGDSTIAIVSGTPMVGLALITFRTNVWYRGPVALLDELYVVPEHRNGGIGSAIITRLMVEAEARDVGLIEINVDESDVDAQRFYERHGFAPTEPGSDERAFYYWQEP